MATTEAPTPLWRAILRVAAALLLPCLLGLLLRMAEADLATWVVATIVASLPAIFFAVRSNPAGRTWSMVVMILLLGIAPMAVVTLADDRPLGLVQRVPVEAAGRTPLAAGLILTDGATPRIDLRQAETAVDSWRMYRGGTSRRQDTYLVAPVVPPGWTTGQPVRVVAVLASRSETSRRVPDHTAWTAPGGILKRLDDGLQARAVRRALERQGLTPADNLVIGSWVPSPAWARLEAAMAGLAVLGAVLLVWTLVLVFDRARPARSRHAAPVRKGGRR